jgi:hypothetical protein
MIQISTFMKSTFKRILLKKISLNKLFSKKISLKKFLIATSMAAVLIILLSIAFIFYAHTIEHINGKLDLMGKNKFYRLYSDIDESINSIKRVIEYLQNSDILIGYLNIAENEKDDVFKKSNAVSDISRLLTNAKEYSKLIKQIFIVTDKSEYSNYSTQMFSFETLEIIRNTEFDDMVFFNCGINKDHHIDLRGSLLLNENKFFVSNISRFKDSNDKIFIILDETLFYDNKQYAGEFYIIDQSGDFIWPTENSYDNKNKMHKEQILKNIILQNGDGEDTFIAQGIKITSKKLDSCNWTLVYTTDDSIIREQRKSIIFYVSLSFITSVFLAYAFSRIISYRMIQPINKLTLITKEYDGKNTFKRHEDTGLQFFSMRDSLFLYYFISIVIPVILFIIMFNGTSLKLTEEHTLSYYKSVFDSTADRLDKYMERKLKAMQRITNNLVIQGNVARREKTVLSTNEVLDIIIENSVLGHERDIINIYDKNNELLFTNYYMGIPDFNQSFYKKINNTYPLT